MSTICNGWDAFDEGYALGLNMAPGIPGTKKAFVKWKPLQERRATEAEIAQWRSSFPRINPLVITGVQSGVIVLDQDGPDAHATIAVLGGMPRTVTVQTPRGAFHEHYWLLYPEGLGTIHNFAGGYDQEMPGVDLRGDGGLAVYPGGTNSQGRSYTFKEGHSPHDIDIADLSTCRWLYDYIKERNEKAAALEAQRHEAMAEAERLRAQQADSVVLRLRNADRANEYSSRMARYAEATRRRQLEKLLSCGQGYRNTQLNRTAYALAPFLNEGIWTELELERELERAAIQVGLDKDPECGISGIRRTITSGLRAGMRNRIILQDRQPEAARR